MLEKLTENWILKLVSLTFAVTLWFFVMGERKLEVGYSVPLEYENIPRGLMIANEVPTLVDVRVNGPRTVLMSLHPTDITISVDLKGLPAGISSFKRLEERLDLPSSVKVTRLSPSFVDVKLERIRQKKVPVVPSLSGTPAEGFTVTDVSVTPSRVTVEGAESEMKDISQIFTESVDVEGVKESFTLMVPLNYQGKYTSLQDHQTAEVRVKIDPVANATPPGERGIMHEPKAPPAGADAGISKGRTQ
jgi:YbbR domain-containing protein